MAYKPKSGGTEAANRKRKPKKMDRYLIAAHQIWEIDYVRTLFFRLTPLTGKIEHPTRAYVRELARQFNNSRFAVYKQLVEESYIQLKPKAA